MDLNISDAIIEVTRKCNMNCEHCLRGDAQRKIIKDEYIYKFMQLIDNIGNLTITGGEPTLAMDSLEKIRECAVYGRADIGNVYMVTNGKSIHVNELADWFHRMYQACTENELSAIAFSFDSFHVNILNWKQMEKQKRNYHRLAEVLEEEYGLYENEGSGSIVQKHSEKGWNWDVMLAEGRAEEYGGRETRLHMFEESDWGGSLHFSETELYLSASGWIVAGCDWSYESIDNNKQIQIAHIDDINTQEELIEAIREHKKKTTKHLELANLSPRR
jgi:hypothetical protein